ncbi:glutathione-dependent formaldehyde dehydrogenase [Caulobacter flavus]|uniref:Glutathione-dependent formaldehyde dehydrogenase n=1 Tax=Caulobacter flavus TaxID=1679497 RepID=A0A2N5CKE8_9CAUL|nr:zinc-dependent alcohol dehydrogenase [Caulobacter flavus]AYV47699.1 glutathione-dependent formaldehyde dehydrogenase [Caulobacter flavus]PLR05801.1 glutathione-dependent formaldehyde dehydrogenase [Caulobacter flavus]
MRALTWHGKHDVRVETVDDPKIINPRDLILKVTATAICGSDLHIYDSFIPSMMAGDVLGHEFMGEVVEVGPALRGEGDNAPLKVGDRVVVPFNIACGNCRPCKTGQFSGCDNSIPAEKGDISEVAYGHAVSGIFDYSHMTGGYAGGQAEYVRVPYGDVGPVKVPDGLTDEQVLFLSDIFPTGWMAAENCGIEAGDTIAVWGCGPVGQFAIRSALLQGAAKVIAIDHHANRLAMAKAAGAEVLNYHEVKVREALMELTGGRGPDACIDAVGMEAHGFSPDNIADAAKAAVRLATDRTHALREVIMACRKGGHVSVPGVYGGVTDKFPVGAFMEKGLTMKTGQTHTQKYMKQLLELIQLGQIDPTFVISHRLPLEEAAQGYRLFKDNQDEVTKVVLRP